MEFIKNTSVTEGDFLTIKFEFVSPKHIHNGAKFGAVVKSVTGLQGKKFLDLWALLLKKLAKLKDLAKNQFESWLKLIVILPKKWLLWMSIQNNKYL